jgi:hypothetical protein
MRRLLLVPACALVAFLGVRSIAEAASITGIMIYSADWMGKPIGFDPETGNIERGQLWRTASHPMWYGLGVLRDFPPESLQGPLLNAGDFSVQIPLSEGEQDFTLVGEPGALSENDGYTMFALSLFFDGNVDRPGLSVVFSPRATRYGDAPQPNQSDILIAFPVVMVSATASASYDDGSTKVTVNGVSFMPPHRFLATDLVSAFAPVPSANGESDWIGVLSLRVEGSAEPQSPANAGSVRRSNPLAFGILPSRAVLSGPRDLPAEEPSGPAPDLQQRQYAAATPAPGEQEPDRDPTPVGDETPAGEMSSPMPKRSVTGSPTRPVMTPTAGVTAGGETPGSSVSTPSPDPTPHTATPQGAADTAD